MKHRHTEMPSTFFFLQILVLLAAAAQADPFYDSYSSQWLQFKNSYGKTYASPSEEQTRMKVFAENQAMIDSHNTRFRAGLETYTLRMNKFGDLLAHEVTGMLNGYSRAGRRSSQSKGGSTFIPARVQLPEAVDWRNQSIVTPVKNQLECGSCWAFAATGSLEGQHALAAKELVSLSEQNLVDCSKDYGNDGCKGGLMTYAYKYIKENNGIDTEESYPYVGKDQNCTFNASTVGATVTGYVEVPSGNEDALQNAVATVGPVAVAIDASHSSFHFYETGVYYERHCSSHRLDHGVLAVGYGVTANESSTTDTEYWLVKNSWGEDWGEEGYIKMSRNWGNNCGIATDASYPLV